MVDIPDLGSGDESLAGSSPATCSFYTVFFY